MINSLRQLPAACLCLSLCVLLAGCEEQANSNRSLRPAACSAEGSQFAKTPFKEWKKLYNESIDAVIEAHMKSMRGISELAIQCTAEDYRAVVPASSALKKVAEMIPAWKDRANAGELHESDMAVTLLEFLRVYECSMNEYIQNFPIIARASKGMGIADLHNDEVAAASIIIRERIVSRKTLERVLSLTGGFDRLQPLSIDIECLKRASLDMRNTLGLASDVSSCLPRIWDAKGSLRDLTD